VPVEGESARAQPRRGDSVRECAAHGRLGARRRLGRILTNDVAAVRARGRLVIIEADVQCRLDTPGRQRSTIFDDGFPAGSVARLPPRLGTHRSTARLAPFSSRMGLAPSAASVDRCGRRAAVRVSDPHAYRRMCSRGFDRALGTSDNLPRQSAMAACLSVVTSGLAAS